MSQVVDTLDKMSRDKQRDVLYITFHENEKMYLEGFDFSNDAQRQKALSYDYDWENDAQRKKVISFLDEHHVSYEECFPPQPTNGVLVLQSSYTGGIYVDVEYDKSNELYMLLDGYLEKEDGTPRMPNVILWYYTLELALKNAEHDEPGFWDNI